MNTPESDKYETTFKSWNDVSELYHDRFSTETLYNDTYDQLCDFIEKNVKLLEIGCGPGNMTKYLLEKRPDLKIKGIDVAPKMIELARQINPQAKFEVMDARDISKLNEKFDAIVSGFCMPYLSDEDSSRLILDCAALLRANGIFYLSTIEGDYLNSGYEYSSAGTNKMFVYYYSESRLKALLNAANLQLIELQRKHYIKNGNIPATTLVAIARKKP